MTSTIVREHITELVPAMRWIADAKSGMVPVSGWRYMCTCGDIGTVQHKNAAQAESDEHAATHTAVTLEPATETVAYVAVDDTRIGDVTLIASNWHAAVHDAEYGDYEIDDQDGTPHFTTQCAAALAVANHVAEINQ